MKRFNEKKLVVLSGAAAGIGYSTALRLADEGANLIVIDYDANGIKALKKSLIHPSSKHMFMILLMKKVQKKFLRRSAISMSQLMH